MECCVNALTLVPSHHLLLSSRSVYHEHLGVYSFNPFLTNGFSHHCHLGESIFIFRGIRSDFKFSYRFLMKILLTNRIPPDGTLGSAASHHKEVL